MTRSGRSRALDAEAVFVWHTETELPNLDAVVLPGGFSYGDYLRCGAIARFAPAMEAVAAFAAEGGLVLGICNGFQILCEAGLLPGVLRRNESLSFVCRDVPLVVERYRHAVHTHAAPKASSLLIPVKHGEGCWYADDDLYDELEATAPDRASATRSPSTVLESDVAGVVNERGNVMGLMPHPEHAVDPLLGSADGALILSSLVESARDRDSRQPSSGPEAERLSETRVLRERCAQPLEIAEPQRHGPRRAVPPVV